MSVKNKSDRGDMTPVLGGAALPADMDWTPADGDDVYPDDNLGRMVYWLMTLHKDKLCLKFRKSDISSMDDLTKKALIADIHEALGVKLD